MKPFDITLPVIYDIEVFPDYIMVGFWSEQTGHVIYTDAPKENLPAAHPDPDLTRGYIDRMLTWIEETPGAVLVGFNSSGYDNWVLNEYMYYGRKAAFDLSVQIIETNTKPYLLPGRRIRPDRKAFHDCIDLMQIVPGRIGLKKAGVCLGYPKLRELPLDFRRNPTADQYPIVWQYNVNDLDVTYELYKNQLSDIDLRVDYSNIVYQELIDTGFERDVKSPWSTSDFRSLARAPFAERMILHKIHMKTGINQYKRELNAEALAIVGSGPVIVFQPFWWNLFVNTHHTPVTEKLGYDIFRTPIGLTPIGTLDKHDIERKVFIHDRMYQMGVGGLHSIDGAGCWIPKDDEMLFDIDVASYYPNIILTNELYPRNLGRVFLEVYSDIVRDRLVAKKAGDKKTSEILKIAINGTYGKSGEPSSSLYDPQLMANVTLLGQLGLLALVERLGNVATVCSANTDGITVLVKKHQLEEMQAIVKQWEDCTRLEMEYTEYTGLYQENVNSYLAVKTAGGFKGKKTFLDAWPDLGHSPEATVCTTAIKAHLRDGTPIEETIRKDRDINHFIILKSVSTGTNTLWHDEPQGRFLRFYKSNSADSAEIYSVTPAGVKKIIPLSDNAMLLHDLPEEFPEDVNYGWYIERAYKTLAVITQPKQPGNNFIARIMKESGLDPCLYSTEKRPVGGGQKSTYESTDFTSVPKHHIMGVKTGDGVIGQLIHATGETNFYQVNKVYPTKSRKKIEKDFGFTLYYGAKIPMSGLFWTKGPYDFDEFYTPGELKKARTPKPSKGT